MSSAGLDIQIVSTPNLQKIENYLNDSTYRETIEISANFNTRLCIERRMRMPFFDSQTGVAQNHTKSLYMPPIKRMPGHREGQIYTYPSQRWRKSKRQYLTKLQNLRPFSNFRTSGAGFNGTGVGVMSNVISGGEPIPAVSDFNASLMEESSSLGGADTSDSKESQNTQIPQNHTVKDDLPKDWYYDEIDINEIDNMDDPEQGDSDYDYNINGYKRKKRRGKPGRKPRESVGHHPAAHHPFAEQVAPVPATPRKGRPPGSGTGSRRGRRKNDKAPATTAIKDELDDTLTDSLAEPPSFESAAAAVESANMNDNSNDLSSYGGVGGSADLRNYRKYL